MKLILLGAPGAGKGTQADIISQQKDIPILGTGNLLRQAVKSQTSEGLKAKEYMDKGELVPDEIIIAMLQKRMEAPDSKNGYILDGFPRNLAQALALDAFGVKIDRVINIQVADEAIMQRLGGRRVCKDCGVSFHVEHNPPKVVNVCDSCSGELIVRSDDNPDTIKERLRVYHEHTAPLIDFYDKKGILLTVEGQEELEATTKLTLAALEASL